MSKVSYEEYKAAKDYAPTGCLLLDLTVGGGLGLGFPYGKMVNVVGDKSSGKTFLAWETAAANYYKYKKSLKWNYDEAEEGDTFNTKKLYGVDLKNHPNNLNNTSDTVEQFDGNTSLFLKEMRSVNQRGIYFCDSLDGLSDADKQKQEKELEQAALSGKKKEGSGSYNTGTASHLSKQYFRTKAGKLSKKKVLLFIVSQVRENLTAGLFGKKLYRAGGKAMDFYAHTCLWLYTLYKIKKGGRKVGDSIVGAKTIGVVVKAVAEKSKTPRPFRECWFTIYFDYGIDNIGSCLDYLYDLRGKDGSLNKNAKNIPWDQTGATKNWDNLKIWIKEIGQYDAIREIKKEETGKKNLTKDWLEAHIENTPELKKLADEYFGVGIDKDSLIALIEDDKKLYEELERRTIDKWEAEEEAVQSNRKRKYS